jgi:hypothetical protein
VRIVHRRPHPGYNRNVVHDWYRGSVITVRFDDERQIVMFVANTGRVPTLELAAEAVVVVTAKGPQLELFGRFAGEPKIVLKIGPADAAGIARALALRLRLPREPEHVAHTELANIAPGTLVSVEGHCLAYRDKVVMEDHVDLRGVAIAIEQDAPYRVVGFTGMAAREFVQVLSIEHRNPPVTWYVGKTVRLIYAPQRELLGIVPQPHCEFAEPAGTLELYLPPETIAEVAVDGDTLVFDGDFSRTNYGTRVRLGPIAEADARAIFTLLDERFQVPRTPRPLAIADIDTIDRPTLVTIEGTFKPGHIEGPNFDGGIQLADRDRFEPGARYRVTGFLYPSARVAGAFIGYHGPRLRPLAVEPL